MEDLCGLAACWGGCRPCHFFRSVVDGPQLFCLDNGDNDKLTKGHGMNAPRRLTPARGWYSLSLPVMLSIYRRLTTTAATINKWAWNGRPRGGRCQQEDGTRSAGLWCVADDVVDLSWMGHSHRVSTMPAMTRWQRGWSGLPLRLTLGGGWHSLVCSVVCYCRWKVGLLPVFHWPVAEHVLGDLFRSTRPEQARLIVQFLNLRDTFFTFL